MRRETEIEKQARDQEKQRRWVWERWQSGAIRPHPEMGVCCPWCGADFCEVDGHGPANHNAQRNGAGRGERND